MKLVYTNFVKLKNGSMAWLAEGVAVPEGATVIEERPMVVPGAGKKLRNKNTGEESCGHWVRGDDNESNWEEVEDKGAEDAIGESDKNF
jgi:hypothetical protein